VTIKTINSAHMLEMRMPPSFQISYVIAPN